MGGACRKRPSIKGIQSTLIGPDLRMAILVRQKWKFLESHICVTGKVAATANGREGISQTSKIGGTVLTVSFMTRAMSVLATFAFFCDRRIRQHNQL